MVFLVGKRELYALEKSTGGLETTKVADFPGGVVASASAASQDALYYVTEENRNVIMRLDVTGGGATEFAKLPAPIGKVVFYRNKVYCTPTEGTCILCVDPLNLSVDSLDTHHNIVDFVSAEHGFVIEDSSGDLYGFHFNYGSNKVLGVSHAEIVGHYKRCGVAVMPCEKRVLGVTERGEILPDAAVPAGLGSAFATSGDDSFVYLPAEQAIALSDGSLKCPVPASVVADGVVALLPVPEQDSEDACTLCFCEFEGDGDGLTLDCGHRFHKECVMEWVGRWDEFRTKGNHVVFTHAVCPGGCKHLARHPLLGEISEAIRSLFSTVSAMSVKQLTTMPPTKMEDDLLYYICSKCSKPFYGGEKVCFRTQSGEPTKCPDELVCDDCQADFHCDKHDRQFVVYKCSYCCNPATDRSFGNRYVCDRCDKRWTSSTEPDACPCPGDTQCPLGGKGHPEKAYAIGCLACLGEDNLSYDKIVPPAEKETV